MRISILSLFLVFAVLGPIDNQNLQAKELLFAVDTVRINGVILHIEIADTQERRVLGLSNRTSLKSEHGMLFSYNTSKIRHFTMKATEIPLSIAFINEDYVIEEILPMQPLNQQLYHSSNPSMYALEVNYGWFKEHEIRPGHKLLFDN